jgi:hypothetical protein
MKRRISDLATEVGIDSKVLLDELKQIGINSFSQIAYLDEYLVELLLLQLEKGEEKLKSCKNQKKCPILPSVIWSPIIQFPSSANNVAGYSKMGQLHKIIMKNFWLLQRVSGMTSLRL